jgi:hypothetical protein
VDGTADDADGAIAAAEEHDTELVLVELHLPLETSRCTLAVKLIEPHRDREARRGPGEVEVEEDQVGVMLLRRGDGALGVVGGPDHAIARIVLDEIFERRRKLEIVFDDEDPEHPASLPLSGNSPRKIRDLMVDRIGGHANPP